MAGPGGKAPRLAVAVDAHSQLAESGSQSSGTLQTSPPAAAARAQEWDAFIAALKRPLPITFRINGQGKFADRLVARLESNFMQQFTEEPVVVSGASCHGLRSFPRCVHHLYLRTSHSRDDRLAAACRLAVASGGDATPGHASSSCRPASAYTLCGYPALPRPCPQIDGEEIEKPHPLAWYPDKLAWQMNFSRAQVRRAMLRCTVLLRSVPCHVRHAVLCCRTLCCCWQAEDSCRHVGAALPWSVLPPAVPPWAHPPAPALHLWPPCSCASWLCWASCMSSSSARTRCAVLH